LNALRRAILPDRFEVAVLSLLLVAIAYQLFVDPVVGVANNADFARLIWPAGIGYQSSADYWGTVFKFSETKFVYVTPKPFRYLTSERPVLGGAMLLNRLFSKDGLFDLRAMGICNLGLYLVAIWSFLASFRRWRPPSRLIVGGAVLVMCADVKWVAYFNSFYCESASLIFLFATVGFALLCADRRREDRLAWLSWLGYLVSALLLWMAKTQNTAFVPCLVTGAWLLFPPRMPKIARLFGTLAIPACVIWAFATNQYADTTGENVRVVVSDEVLRYSPSPDRDRQELGLDKGPGSLFGIAEFYARHPSRWWSMAQRHSQEAFGYIPYGNFSRASGLGPGAQSRAFNGWSEFKKAHFPKNVVLWGCLLLVYAALVGVKVRWLDKTREERVRSMIGPVLALGCLFEFVVSVTFETNGTAKHLFIFNVGVDITLLLALLGLVDVLARVRPWWNGKTAPKWRGNPRGANRLGEYFMPTQASHDERLR
jgi:hypothetical protein